jgi:hypothetical protein
LLVGFAVPVEVFGDGFEFRLDALFFGRDEIQAGIPGLQVVNDFAPRSDSELALAEPGRGFDLVMWFDEGLRFWVS